jgi:hypothetical protein
VADHGEGRHGVRDQVRQELRASSKKQAKVLAEAKKLWGALPKSTKAYWIAAGYWMSYPPDIMQKAQKTIDEAKFKKQLAHRSSDEQDICANCHHEKKKHETGSHAATPCKFKAHPAAAICGCTPYVSETVYADKRAAQGKPTVNPLLGATTNTNTVIVMNMISKAMMEQTITDGIIAKQKELTLAAKDWGDYAGINADCEEISLDFGVKLKGCVMTIQDGQDWNDWVKQQGVVVSIKKETVVDPKKPVYTIGHLYGGF